MSADNDNDNGLCAICRQPFRGYPCNAAPLVDGLCCAECDEDFVTPVRMLRLGVKRDIVRSSTELIRRARQVLRPTTVPTGER